MRTTTAQFDCDRSGCNQFTSKSTSVSLPQGWVLVTVEWRSPIGDLSHLKAHLCPEHKDALIEDIPRFEGVR